MLDQDALDARGRALAERAYSLSTQLREGSESGIADVAETLRLVPEAARRVARRVCEAQGDDLDLLLRALDVSIGASVEQVRIVASMPAIADFSNASALTLAGKHRARFEDPLL